MCEKVTILYIWNSVTKTLLNCYVAEIIWVYHFINLITEVLQ